MTGFLLEGLTNRTLAQKLIEVGEGHAMLNELRKQLEVKDLQPLLIEVDTTAIQEAIDLAKRDIGIYGEIDRVPLIPGNNAVGVIGQIEHHQRIASSAYFSNPNLYRETMLTIAALAVKAIKLFDSERSHLRGVCDECKEQISDAGLCQCRVAELNQELDHDQRS